MVSLEQQSAYLRQFSDSPLAPLLNEILRDEVGELSDDTHNAGDLALNLIVSVKTNDRNEAIKCYTIFCKRKPNKDSHWIYDNYILFCIVCAVRRFGLDPQWIRDVIDLSYTGADQINKKIKDTFKSLLAGNYNAKGDLHQISIVYQFVSKDEHYSDEVINQMFSHLWLKVFPFFEEDFLNVFSIKAIEIAFLKKALLTGEELHYLNYFVPMYNKRADSLASILAWLIIAVLTLFIFFFLWKIEENADKFPLFIKALFFIIGISGTGVLAIWGWRNTISKFIRKCIDLFFRFKTVN